MAKMLQFEPPICHDALPPEFSKSNAYKKKERKSSILFKYKDPSFSNSINKKFRSAPSLRLFIINSTNGKQKVTQQLLYNIRLHTICLLVLPLH
jgi:hypothetical protein